MRSGRLFALFLVAITSIGCVSSQEARQDDRPAGSGSASARNEDKEGVAPERASGFREVEVITAERYLAVAAHPMAAEAAAEILARGGSAIDATIAAQAMLTLVEPQSSGIGGGAFLLYARADGSMVAWDGRETAPSAATAERFLGADGAPLPFMEAIVGGRSVGVPGVVRMLADAHAEEGKLPWKDLFASSIKASEEGFELSPRLFSSLQRDPVAMRGEAAAYFRQADGSPKPAGTKLQNPALAATLRSLAEQGPDAFYKGPIAEAMVDAVGGHANAGDLSLDDLASYTSKKREAICIPYRERYDVCGFPPPTSGGTTVLSILGVLGQRPLPEGALSVAYAHLLVEAERLAYADRGRYLADPDFIDVPVAGMLSEGYLQQRAALIDGRRALAEPPVGEPAGASAFAPASSPELPSTSHLVIVDAEGNIVTMTTSVEFVFGSHVMVKGFLLNNQLTDFSFAPTDDDGRPVANALAAGKRPRSSMAPTLVFERQPGGARTPRLAIGSPGGSRIIGYVDQATSGVLDYGLSAQEAVELPHILSRGQAVELESHPAHKASLAELEAGLRALGHEVKVGELNSGLHAVEWVDGKLVSAADPRREGEGRGE
jgi:gamma-glutamyltranspeptidase/glutathione hydrolase